MAKRKRSKHEVELSDELVDPITEEYLRLLDIGGGDGSVTKHLFPNADIVVLDGNPDANPDILHNIEEPLPDYLEGAFDVVYCSHMLEHVRRKMLFPVLENLKFPLRQNGELWVIVPSLEWAAREVLKNEGASPAVQPVIYGGQDNEWQFHNLGFTLLSLRYLFEKVGMVTRQAYQSEFYVQMGGKVYGALQNIIVGLRYEE